MINYIDECKRIIEKVIESESTHIEEATQLMTRTIEKDGVIHVSGGHCHIYAMETFYRAGGLVPINPLLPHLFATAPHTQAYSDHIYEVEGVGTTVFDDQNVSPNDCIILVSIAGRTIPTIDIALAAKKRGIPVIALQSMAFSKKTSSKHSSGYFLNEVADVTIDLNIPYGDAIIHLDGLSEKCCPVSSVIGFSIIQALVTQTVCNLAAVGLTPPVWVSSNLDRGDAINKTHILSMKGRVSCL
ncbi:sugar isomerase domain-containing protein [Dickeya lacustris]|uniref:Sugar isomerase domain-containing protein n=1 Tax=Dickeya lacustris TaxID=2259638 RepID=A0ABY8G0J3_9GAMM|nr:sugar isomerase domain-containing protein [Dickeya lacustris]WFN54084.1 sugar isomerase domain-containing protein [Dickeya lacustris]